MVICEKLVRRRRADTSSLPIYLRDGDLPVVIGHVQNVSQPAAQRPASCISWSTRPECLTTRRRNTSPRVEPKVWCQVRSALNNSLAPWPELFWGQFRKLRQHKRPDNTSRHGNKEIITRQWKCSVHIVGHWNTQLTSNFSPPELLTLCGTLSKQNNPAASLFSEPY